MSDFLAAWFSSLPSDAYLLMAGLLLGTVALVRSSMHPTLLALVAWPGTVAHEMAHALVGFILGAKPCEFSLFPKNIGNGQWQLGSVGFANMTWWNAPWTAMAPMLLAPLSVWLIEAWVYPAWATGGLPDAWWRLVLCSMFLQSSWPSSTDFRVAAPGLGILAFIGLLLW